MEEQKKTSALEESLLRVMQLLESQVARELQRNPTQQQAQGVQKWEPYQKRVELISSFLLNSFGDDEVTLDSILILAQAFSKSLQLLIEDLGSEGLGEIRSSYCIAAARSISTDTERVLGLLSRQNHLM